MKVTCIQMDAKICCPEENFLRAAALIGQAAEEAPDVIVLPEVWNTGFSPAEISYSLADENCARVKAEIGALAARYGVNIVAGSVTNLRDGKLFNTACIFDRKGDCIAQYDKTHLFSPMGEGDTYTPGDSLCRFTLDGVSCGIIICYDLRFPELSRTLALSGLDVLFVPAQWPKGRVSQLQALAVARAIENQMYVVCCNGCGKTHLYDVTPAGVYGGNSLVADPLGNLLALAEDNEQLISAQLDIAGLSSLREKIPVFRDRHPELYQL